jgi:hypothetical protein
MIGRTMVINAQYEPSIRIGSSRRGCAYIQRRSKIKNKPTCCQQQLINKMIVAQIQAIAIRKLRQTHLVTDMAPNVLAQSFHLATLGVDVFVKMLLRAFQRVTTWRMSTSWRIPVEVPSPVSGCSEHSSLATTRGCVQLLARYMKARIGPQLRLATAAPLFAEAGCAARKIHPSFSL